MARSNTPAGWPDPVPAEDPAAAGPLIVQAEPLPDGQISLHVTGAVDWRTAPSLLRRLIDEARRCFVQPPHLLLDLSEVTFLDDTGLDTLLEMQTRLSNGFGTLELVDPNPRVVRLLHEAHLDGASGTPPHGPPSP